MTEPYASHDASEIEPLLMTMAIMSAIESLVTSTRSQE